MLLHNMLRRVLGLTCLVTLMPPLIAATPPFKTSPLHAQFGGLATGKLLQELHLPSSPADLLQFVLQYALQQKIGNTLPLNLNAGDAYPTVEDAQLPGGPFHGSPLSPTLANLSTALPPGDYVVPVMAYCTQYSVHRPGQGTAYKLAPIKGTEAEAIATLLWRGTLAGKSPQELQATNWAIQSGITYSAMPKPYQALVDDLIPEYRNSLRGNMLDLVQSTYAEVTGDPRKALQSYLKEKYNKTLPLMLLPKFNIPAPPLETVLARMGPAGQLALDAKKQSTILTTAYTTRERGEQVLFEGQGTTTPPQPAGTGPWTVRVPGQVYMRFVIKGGNMQSNNLMQIRLLPTRATAQHVPLPQLSPVLLRTRYAPAEWEPSTSSDGATQTNVLSLLGITSLTGDDVAHLKASGVIGYAQGGEGAQALVPIPVSVKPPCGNPAIVDTYDPSDTGLLKGYHHYVVDGIICLTDQPGCTADAVFAKMLSNSTYIAPTLDTAPVVECKQTTVEIARVLSGTIQTTVDLQQRQITNYTLADHPLKNGKIVRTVISDPSVNWVYVRTEGFGDGIFPEINENSAPVVWGEVDQRLKQAFTPLTRDPRSRIRTSRHSGG